MGGPLTSKFAGIEVCLTFNLLLIFNDRPEIYRSSMSLLRYQITAKYNLFADNKKTFSDLWGTISIKLN